MMLPSLSRVTLKKTVHKTSVCRFISQTTWRSKDGSDESREGAQQHSKAPYPQKLKYPDLEEDILPRVHESNSISYGDPVKRSKRALAYDFVKFKALLEGKPIPPFLSNADILIVGGGLVGSAIAAELLERSGSGMNVAVLETDPPETSTSFHVGWNGIYQQMKLKPLLEMSLFAFDYYRQLGLTYSDPDLPSNVNLEFTPCNSLQLFTEADENLLDDLSAMYLESGFNHQISSPELLKQKFPWMNVDGFAVGCLGMNKEGWVNKMNALSLMRARAKKYGAHFIQGKLLHVDFINMSQYASSPNNVRQYFTPRVAVMQLPHGVIERQQFGYLIIAAGASVHNIMDMLDVGLQEVMKIPLSVQKTSCFEIHCPGGPGIDMPFLIDPSGLKIRKTDIRNSYVVWDDKNCEDAKSFHDLEPNNAYFYEKLLPKLISRIPSFQEAKLKSSYAGLLDVSTWDKNPFLGYVHPLYNTIVASGFGNDEFLFAPGAAKAIGELILDGRQQTIDTSCFRLERVPNDIRLNQAYENM